MYIRRLDDTNVRVCAYDSLYRIVTKFSFLQFLSDGLYTIMKLSLVLFT